MRKVSVRMRVRVRVRVPFIVTFMVRIIVMTVTTPLLVMSGYDYTKNHGLYAIRGLTLTHVGLA